MTGTSVVGIKYKDGILMAADMGGQISLYLFVELKSLHLKVICHFMVGHNCVHLRLSYENCAMYVFCVLIVL